jgi:hypothetical protein
MHTHEIRLRGGWECAGGAAEGPSRLTLPVRWAGEPPGRRRLTRRFHRPPRGPGGPVALRLREAPGVLSVTLNGQPVGPVSADRAEHDLVLGELAPRNELAIDAEPPPGGAPWGVISLLFPEA